MSTPRQRSSSASSSPAKRNGKAVASPTASQTPAPRPATDDRDGWHAHWQAQGQSWRTEPEIDLSRQKELEACRATVPDIEKGIYPFKGMKLRRADVEWLLATHENGRGPVDWSDETHQACEGLDLRAANLSQVDLSHLPLARLHAGLGQSEEKGTEWQLVLMAAARLEQADFSGAHLEGAILTAANLMAANFSGAYLKKADLGQAILTEADFSDANLEEADFFDANLEAAKFSRPRLVELDKNMFYAKISYHGACLKGAELSWANLKNAKLEGTCLENACLDGAHLEGADLNDAYLEGTDLSRAYLDEAKLSGVILANTKRVGPQLIDVHWNGVNLTSVKWRQVDILGDEYKARQRERDGRLKDKGIRSSEYERAALASRQLSIALQSQGLNRDAARFAYRAQVLERSALRFQITWHGTNRKLRWQALREWFFSWFLFLLAGYGYKPGRSFLAYLLVISGFATAYYLLGHIVGPTLSPLGAFVFSMTSFHGRGFFPGNNISLDDPLTVLAALEALVGLIIEVTFIATLTQRFFNR